MQIQPDDATTSAQSGAPGGCPVAVAGHAPADGAARAAAQVVLADVCRRSGWALAQLFVIDHAGVPRPWTAWHDGDVACREFVAATGRAMLSSGIGLPGRVASTGHRAAIADLFEDPNFPRAAVAADAGLRSAVAFPLADPDGVVAVVEVLGRHAGCISEETLTQADRSLQALLPIVAGQRPAAPAAASTDRLRQILDTAGDAFIGMDAHGNVTEWNREAERTFGWARHEALGQSVTTLMVPPEYHEAHDSGLARFLATGEARALGQRLEVSSMHRDGRQFPIELTLWALQDGPEWSFYAFARDITARKEAEESLARDALHDGLTGLANRTTLMTRLTHALNQMSRGEPGPALLFVDLDRFKLMNDTFGHAVGDQVLKVTAERLTALVRPTDVAARLAGDEFVVLLDATSSARDASLVADRIVEAMQHPVPLDEPDHQVVISASVGVALARPGSTPESLLRDADAAMYQAKHAGRGRYDIYGDQLRDRVTSRLHREAELARALDLGQFELYYQPVYRLGDRTLSGVEALLRWRHPELDLLLPADFIDIAEESGQIVPIGAWVLREACEQLHQWRQTTAAAAMKLSVAVNLSARQLAHQGLVHQVEQTLAEAGLPSTDLQFGLEITESVLMHDPATAADVLRDLKNLGVAVAIDDFGTGYSSLAYLKWFPVETVKIDRSFVQTIASNRTDRAIVDAIVHLTTELGMTTVAEGVEETEQLDLVMELGCTHAQGFLLGRPMPAPQLTTLLAQVDDLEPSALVPGQWSPQESRLAI